MSPKERPRDKDGDERTLTRRARDAATRSRSAREPRLDTPLETQRSIRVPTLDRDAFGVFAEQFARFMGTATFLIYMTLFVVVWVLWNVGPWHHFDDYPFIFLTLMLSLQASYAAPLILLAQNRQEQRDRVVAEQDRQTNNQAHADMEFLAREMASLRMLIGEVATRDYVRSELRSLLAELEDRDAEDDPGSAAGDSDGETDPTPRASGRSR